MQIDKGQLSELTDQVDQLHHESMRTLKEEFGEIHFGEYAKATRGGRRDFMKKAGVGGAALTVGSMVSPISRFLPAAWAEDAPLDDAALAAFAAGLELAAVAAYGVAVDTGKLSAAAAKTGGTFKSHHQDHADALNSILGDAAVDKPNNTVVTTFAPMIQKAKDEAAVLTIAYQIEEAAAATYLFALGAITDLKNAGALATILPVESQHAVVLGTAVKMSPADYLPDFQNQDAALNPSKFPA